MTDLNLHEKPLYGLFLEFILDGTWNYIIDYRAKCMYKVVRKIQLGVCMCVCPTQIQRNNIKSQLVFAVH